MKVLLALFIVAIVVNCSQTTKIQYPPLTRTMKERKPDTSVKGYQWSAPKDVESENVSTTKEYRCKDHEGVDEAANSLTVLTMIGDRDLLLSEHDDHHEEHCADAKEHLEVFEQHAKCVTDNHKSVLESIAKGMKEMVHRRCDSKEWHKKYIHFSKCMFDPEVQETIHRCIDNVGVVSAYALKNIAKKKQHVSICCYVPTTHDCLYNKTKAVCGEEAGLFAVDTFFDGYKYGAEKLCQGQFESHCEEKTLKAFAEIARAHRKLEGPGTWTHFLKVLYNTYND